MQTLVNAALKNVSSLSDLKNITIKISGQEEAFLNCDLPWQIEALTNILKNSLDHSKPNSILEINYAQNNIYAFITIKDYGEGISKKDINHIFERFYKGSNANPDSVGIGLALAKTIIEKNNGTISVISSPKGTTFTIKYYH